jgi:hypothetical protein
MHDLIIHRWHHDSIQVPRMMRNLKSKAGNRAFVYLHWLVRGCASRFTLWMVMLLRTELIV